MSVILTKDNFFNELNTVIRDYYVEKGTLHTNPPIAKQQEAEDVRPSDSTNVSSTNQYTAGAPFLKRNDLSSTCFVELRVTDEDKHLISSGVCANIKEASYRILWLIRDVKSATKQEVAFCEHYNKPWRPSEKPPCHFFLRCFPNNIRTHGPYTSGRFDRAKLDRVLPDLGNSADWSNQHIIQFRMLRPRRIHANGRRFPKRSPTIDLSLNDIERRLRTRRYYRKPLYIKLIRKV